VIVEINSCAFIKNDKKNENRGRLHAQSLLEIDKQLKSIPKTKLKSAVRIAVLHHHPILLPEFAEPARGYDSVIESSHLFSILKRFSFHAVVHGHKHQPLIFTYDIENQWVGTKPFPVQIIAGGSAGTSKLDSGPSVCNTYSLITITWNFSANDMRLTMDTRGLVTTDKNNNQLLPNEYKWQYLKRVDRRVWPTKPDTKILQSYVQLNPKSEKNRKSEYSRLRGNMPVLEIVPSVMPDQDYEARLSIIGHDSSESSREIPDKVIWSAGPKFSKSRAHETLAKNNPNFLTTFHYWGPMLVQATLYFKDGDIQETYIYAFKPGYLSMV
jgi:hypothetical protein